MTPCSLSRPASHNSTSSTSRSGLVEGAPHPTDPAANPLPDRDEHDAPTIPTDPDRVAVGYSVCR